MDIECFHEEMIKKIVEESIDSLKKKYNKQKNKVMKEENNNNVNEQQAKIEKRQKVMTIYNKIIAIADKITDDYNDDPDVTPNHELLAIGVFMRRMELSLIGKDVIGKDGKPLGDQTPDSTDEPTYATMLDVIKNGYEMGKMTECRTSEEPEQTSEDNGK